MRTSLGGGKQIKGSGPRTIGVLLCVVIGAAALGLSGVAVGQDDTKLAPDWAKLAPAAPVSTAQRPVQILIERDVPMAMRDGTILRADVYRPNDGGKYPVILTRTPYNKLSHSLSGRLNAVDLVYAGYVRVVQDIRGRYASEGSYAIGEHVTPQGMNDAYDTVEWIAAQPWCDGNVGMIGGSYEGSVQWPAAMAQPPHLKAIAPSVGPCGFLYEQAMFGGPPYYAFLTYWTLIMGSDVANRLEKEGQDVTRMREMMADAMADRAKVLNHLPLRENPYLKFPGMWDIFNAMVLSFNPDFESPLLRGAMDASVDMYGLSGWNEAVYWPYHLVKVPVLNIGGWYDVSTWSTFANFTGMREKGGSEFARAHQHVLMGPWQHAAQNADHLGDLELGGYSVAAPTMFRDVVAFFDRYLRGRDVEIPAVRYFTMGENRWHTSQEWPLAGTQVQRFYLHSGGAANTAAGDGALRLDPPGDEPADSYVYDPANPVPTTGGRHIEIGGVISGPRDQIYVERRNDVLSYTTAVLADDVEVTGWVKLHLQAATSARDTDFTAQLIDVHPDGRGYNMADGVIRARYRDSIFKPELVTPGEVDEYTISLGVTSHLFKKGHRIRLDVSSSNFPAWDRNMNTGKQIGEDTEGIKATQTIHHSAGHASFLELPVIPR